MDSTPRGIIRETFLASNEGRLHFGDAVARLTEAGVESYAVDYRNHSTTYCLASDATLALPMESTAVEIGREFAAASVQEAIRAAQKGAVMYPEFKRRSMQAGCIGYTVWIAGRHVTYFGRKGEMHVEPFPDN